MYSSILVPLDGSELSERALGAARDIAKTYDSTVHLLQVVSRSPELEARRTSGMETAQSIEYNIDLARERVESQMQRAKEYLDSMAAGLQSAGVKTATALAEGSADEGIVNYAAENGIDLIVMSTHGHGGLRRLFLGSTTDRVIRSSEKPVLVVPPA
jgi:nucleotide-binding universal stress UspA family protein